MIRIAATTTLRVVDNSWWGVQGGWDVRVHWMYLDRVPDWEADLPADIRADIDKGNAGGLFHGPYRDFPNYLTMGENTLELLELTAPQVNLLAHLTAWTVTQQRGPIEAMITGSL